MMRATTVVVLVFICAAVWAQYTPSQTTANVAVTESRVSQPFVVDWVKVSKLASRIFAEPWLRSCKPEWSESYPSPSRITTTYGYPAKGDSLTPVNDVFNQRPCWVFWKDDRSGVAVEKGVRGNWIVSTFVVDQTVQVFVPGPVTYVDRPVDRVVTVTQPVAVPTFVPARQFICPATVTALWTPAMPVAVGSSTQTESVKVWGTVGFIPKQRREVKQCPPKPPICPPGQPPTPPD